MTARPVASRMSSSWSPTASPGSRPRSRRCGPTRWCRLHLFTMVVAGWSRRSPAPFRSGPVQTCCLRGPDADLSGRGGGGPCICQREQRRFERRDEVPTRPADSLRPPTTTAHRAALTRTQTGVNIPDGTVDVVIEGRDSENGYGGDTVSVPSRPRPDPRSRLAAHLDAVRPHPSQLLDGHPPHGKHHRPRVHPV